MKIENFYKIILKKVLDFLARINTNITYNNLNNNI